MQKFFLKNVSLRTKFDLRLKKKTKNFWAKFSKLLEKFLFRHQKNASHTISIYGNCMISIFFKKRKPRFFLPDCFIRIKQPHK